MAAGGAGHVDQLIQDILHGGVTRDVISKVLAERTVLVHVKLGGKSETGPTIDDKPINSIATDRGIGLVERVEYVDKLS